MQKYLVHGADGVVLRHGVSSDPASQAGLGETAIEHAFDNVSPGDLRIDPAGGSLVDYIPPAPAGSPMQTWASNAGTERGVSSPNLDYGAAAARYIDAYFANIRWDAVSRRLEAGV